MTILKRNDRNIIRTLFFLCITMLLSGGSLMASADLFPVPQKQITKEGYYTIKEGRALLDSQLKMQLADEFAKILSQLNEKGNVSLRISAAMAPNEQAEVSLRIDSDVIQQAQGYRLDISSDAIEIIASDAAGAYYAMLSLKQVVDQAKGNKIPCQLIVDWPDFDRRGVMLDISRDKVPTMETLKLMIDRFASWKINELQLYVEHTFAYKNHETVWRNASPLTAEQVLELDEYCTERFIDLVPNQNSLGHMHRWLDHKEYRYLAERPGDASSDVWHINNRRVTLSAVNPQSVEFMDSLFAEYLPNFSSKYVNVGGDEPYELGLGTSKAECERIGKSSVYLNYMKKIVKRVNQYGKKAQMWGDIVSKHPELIPQMPKEITCMVWGYRPEHPFKKQCSKFQEEGIPFYVCPGTSGWRTYIGKMERAKLNIVNAIENGKKYGAMGVLNTDWGDRGHMQPLTTAMPAFLYGAGMSWAVEANKAVDLKGLINTQIFYDKTGLMGEALLQLTNAYRGGKDEEQAGTPYFQMMDRIEVFFQKDFEFKNYDLSLLPGVRKEIKFAMKKLAKAKPESVDAEIAIQEMRTAAKLADWGCRFVEARLKAPEHDVYQMKKETRKVLAEELDAIAVEHCQTWLLRNRAGGLDDSVARMEKVNSLLLKGL